MTLKHALHCQFQTIKQKQMPNDIKTIKLINENDVKDHHILIILCKPIKNLAQICGAQKWLA